MEYKTIRLSDFATINMGQSPKSEYYNYDGDGLPFLQGNRTFGRLFPVFDTYTTAPTKIAEQGDIIMSVRAPVGDLNIAPTKLCLGRGVCSLKAKKANQTFLFYLMKHYVKQLIHKESGTVFGSVNRDDIANLEVSIPEESVQHKIATVLSSLDTKIEQNTAINNNLEQQAQALFKSWFIDFEPFGGTMPEDWSERYLSEFVELTQGKYIKDVSVNKTEKYKYPVYGGGGIRGFVAEYTHADPVVIVGCRGTCGIVDRTFQSASITNSVISFDIKSLLGINFLYLFLKNRGLTEFISGSAVPQITKTALSNISLLVPSENILKRFEEITGSFYSYITSNKFENERLAEIRDALLPKLMSGEIDVSKVDISDLSYLDKSLFNKETE